MSLLLSLMPKTAKRNSMQNSSSIYSGSVQNILNATHITEGFLGCLGNFIFQGPSVGPPVTNTDFAHLPNRTLVLLVLVTASVPLSQKRVGFIKRVRCPVERTGQGCVSFVPVALAVPLQKGISNFRHHVPITLVRGTARLWPWLLNSLRIRFTQGRLPCCSC